MTEKEYRASPGISRSELWLLMESPEKAKWAWEHPEQPTNEQIFGTVVHKLLLEPNGFDGEFMVFDTIDGHTKAGKQNKETAKNAGKTPVSVADFSTAQEMVAKLKSTPYVARLLEGEHEKPIKWNDDLTGELCKVRLDCLSTVGGAPIVVDYKTAADATIDGFTRSALKYGYDFQAGMYCEAVQKATGIAPRFVFIVQEKKPPYSVNILEADELFVKRGFDTFRELIGIYHECKTTGNWYGYMGADPVIKTLYLPSWAAKE